MSERKNLKIGFTERGDGGLDLSWVDKLTDHNVDGAVIVTKNLTTPARNAILQFHKAGFPIMVHAGITGWGGTDIEPRVPEPAQQLHNIHDLLSRDFPADRLVVRIDPIIPNSDGLSRVKDVIESADYMNIFPRCRCRVSVLDEYAHVKDRLRKICREPFYGPDRFYAPSKMMNDVAALLKQMHDEHGIMFETCAEPLLASIAGDVCIQQGCISRKDLEILGLTYDDAFQNPQGRSGCHCLGCKCELLTHKCQCPHGCVYCYWKT